MTLWLLLATSLCAILLIAFSDDISIGKYTVRKAPLSDLWIDKEKEAKTAVQDSMEVAKALKPMTIKTDTTSQSLFIFGDSMTYNLALRLAQYAKQNGHTIHAVNWDSSNTKIWADHDTLAYFINKYKPTHIFVALGSNELYIKNPESRLPHIEKILSVIDSIPFVWIGPPNWQEDYGINDLLARTCGQGHFFLSNGMEFKRKSDNVHPTRESSSLWMDSIMRWLPKSAHPFKAALPSDSVGKATPNIVFLKALNK